MFALSLAAASGAALAGPPAGQIDFTFGAPNAQGITEVEFDSGGGWNDLGAVLAEDAQGRLVMAGIAEVENGRCLGLMRFSADGLLDTVSFGFNQNQIAEGKVCHSNPLGIEAPLEIGNFADLSLAFQLDGRIVVAGWAKASPFVCRFEDDGRLDTGFGTVLTPGCVRFPALESSNWPAPPILVRDDSLVLIAQRDGQSMVARLSQQDGSPILYGDDSFVPLLEADASESVVWDATLTADGDVIAVGQLGWDTVTDFLIARFDVDTGLPDAGFAGQGWRSIAFDKVDEGYDYASAAHVTSAGALLVAGVVENSSGRQLGLVQLDAVTGEFDPVFNGGQPLEYDPCEDVPQGCFLSVDAVMRTASGRVVIAGGKDYRMFAARLLTNLAPDETFGDLNGMATTPAGGYFWASGGAVLQGENIVLGGRHGDLLNDDEDFALLRLSGGGDLFRDSFEVSP